MLTNEHVSELGRVEKRTLFIKPLRVVFPNEYARTAPQCIVVCTLVKVGTYNRGGDFVKPTPKSKHKKGAKKNGCDSDIRFILINDLCKMMNPSKNKQ